jgi:radical SAM protein with 4Fe4S-binding SPASM domain
MPPRRSLFVMMDLTNRCNLSCRMCPRHHGHPPPIDLDLDVLRKIAVDLFPYASGVSLSCGGEPLMARHFDAALDIVAAAGVPHVDFVTNATLLTERRIRKVMSAGLRRIMVSLDAATPETYEDIRLGASFDRVIGNLRLLRRLKAEAGTPYPRLRLNLVLMRRNVRELPDYLRLARELGATEIDVRHVITFPGLGIEDESLAADGTAVDRVLVAARRQALAAGMLIEAPPPSGGREAGATPLGRAARGAEQAAFAAANGLLLLRHGQFGTLRRLGARAVRRRLDRACACPVPAETLVLGVEGDVLPCPFWYREHPLGNLARESFAAIWQGPGYAALRAGLRGAAPLPDACRACPWIGAGNAGRADPDRLREG